MTPEEQEKYRVELAGLRHKRDELIGELGAYAQENNDLRENSAYINVERKIQLVDAQIARILVEFGRLNVEKIKAKHALKKPRKLSRVDL